MKFLTNLLKTVSQWPIAIRYGIYLAIGLIVFKSIEYQYFSYKMDFEIYATLIALLFTVVGIIAGIAWFKVKKTDNDKENLAEPLSPKEIKLLQGLAEGLTYQQLADANHLSINTIKSHLKNIYKKLNVENKSQAVAIAKRHALL